MGLLFHELRDHCSRQGGLQGLEEEGVHGGQSQRQGEVEFTWVEESREDLAGQRQRGT